MKVKEGDFNIGDLIVNEYAGESNPQRVGKYCGIGTRTSTTRGVGSRGRFKTQHTHEFVIMSDGKKRWHIVNDDESKFRPYEAEKDKRIKLVKEKI